MSDNDLISRSDVLAEVDRYRSEWDYAREQIVALPAAPTFTAADLEREWQPIETAPRDGTRLLCLTWDGVIKQGYLSERYMHADHCMSIQTYTHWMPRPQLPADLVQHVKE